MKFVAFLILSFLMNSNLFAALPIWLEDVQSRPESFQDTPNFVDRQFYLEAAPKGVGAKTAWMMAGGKGQNVKIIDIEVGYEDKHEDFNGPFYLGSNPQVGNGHGTAVFGIMGAGQNEFGVTGIAHEAKLGFYGFIEGEQDDVDQKYIDGIVTAIRSSAAQLSAGDVMVIEQHMVGPDNNKYTAVEFWDPIFKELKAVTDKGIHCIEAAGNGNSDFDSEIYKGAFDLAVRDSGCILVGAGAPTTHERLSFSNYGSRIDAHGYGSSVTSTGYGDLFNGGNQKLYTNRFSGTSSATPIVAGAVALVSSIAKEAGITVTPKDLREALRKTGTKQGSATTSEKIGNMPEVSQALQYLKIIK